ncbi:MAG: hemerythrin family protein [Desulfobacterales bacterium]|nr:hemerythrin family protein [Desulfobacterales bacterium]
MSLFNWDDSLRVNVIEFDGQHQRLVRYVNELYEAIEARRGNEVLEQLLGALLSYTETHFVAEESLMEKYGYPNYIKHKAEHDDLIRQVNDLRKDFETKGTAMSLKVLVFLKDWVRNHIMGSDKRYSDFFKEHGVT